MPFLHKWVGIPKRVHTFLCKCARTGHHNWVIIDSLAFGGRGDFVTRNTRKRKRKRTRQNNNSENAFRWVCNLILPILLCWLIITAAVLARTILVNASTFGFDITIGIPGEDPNKWSKKHPNFSVVTWNTRSLIFERCNYCKNLDYDILAISELWRSAEKFTNGTVSFINSKPRIDENTGAPLFPDDVASGVGILLSERAQSKYMMRHGSPCERIAWVHLKGPVTNLFVIAAYIPHRARPCQNDTLSTLIELLKQVPKNNCIVLLVGDFNEQLPKNLENLTGKWAYGTKSANADVITDIMRMFNLAAASTMFQPKQKSSTAT